MGNTCSRVHVKLPRESVDLAAAVSKAYGKLGYDRQEKPRAGGAKHVIVRHFKEQPFLSVYDSDNDRLDSGELKELSLLLSKALSTSCVFTSVYDSDSFEFIVFANGKQVDMLRTDPESYSGPLKTLSGKARASQWNKIFKILMDPEQINEASRQGKIFAEENIAQLGALIGLSAEQCLGNFQDIGADQEKATQLYFTKNPSARPTAADGKIALRNYFDAEDSQKLMVYPASWPCPVAENTSVQWLVLSDGAGFSSGCVTLTVKGPDSLKLNHLFINGCKFHNGQICGPLETAPRHDTVEAARDFMETRKFPALETAGDSATESRTFRADFQGLEIPPMTASRSTQILLIFVLEMVASTEGSWEISAALQTDQKSDYAFELPQVSLAARNRSWLTVVSGLNPKTFYDLSVLQSDRQGTIRLAEMQSQQKQLAADRRLEHDSILSIAAILEDHGQKTLDQCRCFFESWLKDMQDCLQGEALVFAAKQMTASAHVGKTKKTLALSSLVSDKLWKKLFTAGSDFQTVLIDLVPEGCKFPIAGLGLQISMRETDQRFAQEREQRLAETLKKMRGRDFESMPLSSTVHLFGWVINHENCLSMLQTSKEDLSRRLDSLAANQSLIQAWQASCTWKPLFDLADGYKRTVYEDSSILNWFRGILGSDGGLDDIKMSQPWCKNVLRMVSPHLWICRNLLKQCQQSELAKIAKLEQLGDACNIKLNPDSNLADLELALLPILPVETVRLKVKS